MGAINQNIVHPKYTRYLPIVTYIAAESVGPTQDAMREHATRSYTNMSVSVCATQTDLEYACLDQLCSMDLLFIHVHGYPPTYLSLGT